MHPLVRDLADDGISVTVTCRVLCIARQPYYRWLAAPVSDAELDVWYRSSLIAHSFLTEEFFAAERQEIAHDLLPMTETTVYESDGRVVGFVSLIENEVGAIFVDPDHQRRGIGRALMDRFTPRVTRVDKSPPRAPDSGLRCHTLCLRSVYDFDDR